MSGARPPYGSCCRQRWRPWGSCRRWPRAASGMGPGSRGRCGWEPRGCRWELGSWSATRPSSTRPTSNGSSRPGRRTPSTTSSMTSGGRTRPIGRCATRPSRNGRGRATTTGPAARRRHPDRQLSRPRRGAGPLAPVCRRGGDRRLRRRHRVRATVGRPVLQRGQRPQPAAAIVRDLVRDAAAAMAGS
jgi:hypothetical protein